ncbi:hypothetical protein BX616_001860 [Lobosporangium transversale]|uniref:Cupredoxin n=1 Tax=Lobosporangium transversale TaxID=64571 RepID=A0A1Y2GSX0_9FUNG|nr:hypothetical protein BCR41DRAFT_421265 [Lobosporangium transversale]KAF9902648.1 hypothetical protein BX616_001860 [Lobosporangium transversale]ORZ20181.1 hypothetical protein BCR41DRAFT_421265 [Lobosporangium transversale]|eukprot:XP_021882721.1 hypothetical protein BCR41DRAFT_421265 [Lobosporangium transversale]
MRFEITTFTTLALLVAPALAAKTWDVKIDDGKFSPSILDISPGDTVRWPLDDGGDHAIVETIPGPQSCTAKSGGFNSGRKTAGQPYQRTFPVQGVVNYKDGIGANCAKNNTVGTIYVGPRPSDAVPPAPVTSITSAMSSASASASASVSSTIQQRTSTTSMMHTSSRGDGASHTSSMIAPTNQPSNANKLVQSSIALGFVGLIAALAAAL